MVQPIQRWVAAWIASCRFNPACRPLSTSSAKWRPWRLSSKQHGIPKGLPYLTGFVIHCEIVEEALAD